LTTFADPSTFPSVFELPVEKIDPATAVVETTDTTASGTADTSTDESGAAAVDPIEEITAEAVPAAADAPGFDALGVPAELVRVLTREGIITPFEIQVATIPDALAGRDVLGRGQTGSGKTLAFGLPLLARIAKSGRALPHQPKALILVPTRELAMQVADALMPLGRSVGVFLKTAVGGVPYDRQVDSLRRGVEVIVATPGRLGDLIERGVCKLDAIEITVLDEADQMADMGFLPEVTELLSKTPHDSQRLLFSATLDGDVDALVRRFMNNPVTHSTAPAEASVSTMDHHMLLIPPHDKFAVTAQIAAREGKTIVFARTQLGVDRLVEQLAAVGVRAGALHGGKTQRVRTRTLAQFKEGRTNVLVATDVAARGIHVDGISLVMHVDPPKDPKDYLHRAGRTARAGESGAVATLVLPKQRRSTLAMMLKAGVEPTELRVRLGDPGLAEVTGAREPSGVPVPPEPEERGGRGGRDGDRPRRSFGDRPQRSSGGYGDRPRSTGGYSGGGSSSGGYAGSSDRRSSGAPTGGGYGRPTGDRPSYGDRPTGDRPSYGDRPSSGGSSYGSRPSGDRSYGDRPAPARTFSDRPAGFRHEGPRDERRPAAGAPAAGGERRYGSARPARSH
jgi:superfamily II DNA/RNA helicase